MSCTFDKSFKKSRSATDNLTFAFVPASRINLAVFGLLAIYSLIVGWLYFYNLPAIQTLAVGQIGDGVSSVVVTQNPEGVAPSFDAR